jgi:hypothetical protein
LSYHLARTNLTLDQAKCFAHEMTKRYASDSAAKLAGATPPTQTGLPNTQQAQRSLVKESVKERSPRW